MMAPREEPYIPSFPSYPHIAGSTPQRERYSQLNRNRNAPLPVRAPASLTLWRQLRPSQLTSDALERLYCAAFLMADLYGYPCDDVLRQHLVFAPEVALRRVLAYLNRFTGWEACPHYDDMMATVALLLAIEGSEEEQLAFVRVAARLTQATRDKPEHGMCEQLVIEWTRTFLLGDQLTDRPPEYVWDEYQRAIGLNIERWDRLDLLLNCRSPEASSNDESDDEDAQMVWTGGCR